jgi:hypothetical protein
MRGIVTAAISGALARRARRANDERAEVDKVLAEEQEESRRKLLAVDAKVNGARYPKTGLAREVARVCQSCDPLDASNSWRRRAGLPN